MTAFPPRSPAQRAPHVGPPDASPAEPSGAPSGGPSAALAPDDWRAVFEASAGAKLVLAPDPPRWTILAATPTYARLTLTDPRALAGRALFDAFSDANPDNPGRDGVANLGASLARVLRHGTADALPAQRYDLERPDGTWEARWWAVDNIPVHDADGRVRLVVHHVEDITALRHTEAERARFELLAEHSNDAQYLIDAAGRIQWANRVACERMQYTRDEITRLTVADLNPVVGLDGFPAYFARAQAGRVPPFESTHRRRDGHTFPVEIAPTVVALPEGPRLLAAVRDITARKAAEARTASALAITAALGRALTPDEVAEAIAAHLVPAVGAASSHAALLADDAPRDAARTGAPDAVDGALGAAHAHALALVLVGGRGLPPDLAAAWQRLPLDYPIPMCEVARTGRPVLLPSRDEALARFPALAQVTDRLDAEAFAVLPLAFEGRTIGALTVAFDRPHPFPPEEHAFLLAVAAQCAQAMERARLFEAERRTRETLRRSEERYALAARATSNAIWDWDLATDGLTWNDGIRTVFGHEPTRVASHAAWWADAIHPDDRARVVRDIHAVIASGREWAAEYRFRRGDGTWAHVRDRGYVAREPDADGAPGRAVRMIGAMEDVTAERDAAAASARALAVAEATRRDAERERANAERAREEAERANRAKSDFLAVMSHELRTPLNAIGGYAELIAMGIRGPVSAQQVEDLGRIQASQRHLLGLINEVLNYAKLESGAVRYACAPVHVCDVLRAAEGLVASQARAKGLTLAITSCPAELRVHADADKVRQILLNLLSNAVKFTRARDGLAGRVTVAVDAPPADAPPGAPVAIHVEDTGIGIPADKLATIFEPFVQVRSGLTREHEGTGLGLAISRDLARGMGGELRVESTVGVGSTFTLVLPLEGGG